MIKVKKEIQHFWIVHKISYKNQSNSANSSVLLLSLASSAWIENMIPHFLQFLLLSMIWIFQLLYFVYFFFWYSLTRTPMAESFLGENLRNLRTFPGFSSLSLSLCSVWEEDHESLSRGLFLWQFLYNDNFHDFLLLKFTYCPSDGNLFGFIVLIVRQKSL